MAKPGELKWDDFLKKSEDQSSLKKSNERAPSAQYHADKPKGAPIVNAESNQGKVSDTPAAPINRPGEVPRRPTNIEISQAILSNLPKQMRQPTHAEQVEWAKQAGLVKSKEQLEEQQKDWENKLNNFYKTASAPIEDQKSKDNESWGSGQSFNDTLSEEELEKRNTYINPNE